MKREPKVLWIEDNDVWLELRVLEITQELAKDDIEFDHYPLEDGDFLEDNFQYYPDFNIAAVDYGLGKTSGIDVIKKILKFKHNCKIVLYSFDESLNLRTQLINQLNAEEKVLGIYYFSTKNELADVLVSLSKELI